MPAIAAYTPKDVWDLTQQGWDFLKFIYGLAAKGEKPMYEAKDNATINVFHGDNVRVYNAPVVKIGDRMTEKLSAPFEREWPALHAWNAAQVPVCIGPSSEICFLSECLWQLGELATIK